MNITLNRKKSLPPMEPVLTDVTLYHEASHIIWQATQAVHWYGCHSNQTIVQQVTNKPNSISNRITKQSAGVSLELSWSLSLRFALMSTYWRSLLSLWKWERKATEFSSLLTYTMYNTKSDLFEINHKITIYTLANRAAVGELQYMLPINLWMNGYFPNAKCKGY